MFDELHGENGLPHDPSGIIPLGYGAYVRADRVFALVPIEGPARGEGQRTYVHVEGLAAPLVASRSERAILADIEQALAHERVEQRRRRLFRRGSRRTASLTS
jgi:hypothetical protein